MEPQNKPPEPPREHQSLILQPTDEAAFLKEMEAERQNPVPPAAPVPETTIELQQPAPATTLETPMTQYATYTPPQPVPSDSELSESIGSPATIRWKYLLGIGALIPAIIAVFDLIIDFLVPTMLLFVIAMASGPFATIVFLFISLLPLLIAYKIVTKRLREKVFLDHARLIFFGTCIFLIVAKIVASLIFTMVVVNSDVNINPWMIIVFELGATILSSMVGIVLMTLITNVWNRNNPVRRMVIAWSVLLAPIVLAIVIYAAVSISISTQGLRG